MVSYREWVAEISTATGTGPITLDGALAAGWFRFRERFANGSNEIVYWVESNDRSKREKNRLCTLTYGTPDSLSRNVVESNNSDAPWPWVGSDHPLRVYIAQDSDIFNKVVHGIGQTVAFQTGEVATGTTIIPGDDSIPQSNEGDEYMELAITPEWAGSNLVIDVTLHASHTDGGPNTLIAALFRDGGVNAVKAGWAPLNGSWAAQVKFTAVVPAGSTAPTTFRVRAGATNAGTLTFNGISGARFLGGVLASSIVIREVP